MAELYNKHRPKEFKRMIGNARNIAILEKVVSKQPEDRPHTFLFTGNTGCGKTTLGYILAKELGCTGDNLEEYNSASFRGIDSVREIQQKMQRMPTAGSKCRVFLLEEAHRFTKDAQEALLKPTENCPKHVYFIFTTTNPEALIPTLKQGRVMSIPVDTLTEEELIAVMNRSLKLEKEECSDAILQGIAKQSLGSARNAISILEKVIALPEKERKNWKEVVQDTETMAIDLCRALMKRPSFKEIAPILKNMKEDAETVRRAVLGYANAVFLGGNYEAYNIIDCFDRNYYDTGKAGLSKSCYDYLAGTDPIKSAK